MSKPEIPLNVFRNATNCIKANEATTLLANHAALRKPHTHYEIYNNPNPLSINRQGIVSYNTSSHIAQT